MFTGIIEEMGTLAQKKPAENAMHLTIQAHKVLEGTAIGDSIATNGVCLTVVDLTDDALTVDVMHETLKNTNLGALEIGDALNLERALTPASRMGGHFVSGHVDGTGVIERIQEDGIAKRLFITVPEALTESIVLKGSIAVDGISLTVYGLSKTHFEISIIPHTQDVTTLLKKKPGDTVNIETDMIGKYVLKMTQSGTNLSTDDLKKWGY
mgnify:CR=1 FL=1